MRENTDINNESAGAPERACEAPTAHWIKMSTSLKKQLGEETFDRWFSGASLEVEADTCTIILDTDTALLWVETNFTPEINQAVQDTFTDGILLELAHRSQPAKETPVTAPSKPQARTESSSKVSLETLAKRAKLNPTKSFANFVVGSNSQFAHAACQAISNGASRGYNPLFVHCNPGLGKTHLVQALGQDMLKNNPKSKVSYLTGEDFTNKYIEAVRKGTTDAFRRRYRKLDMLILDDVHFLVGKGKSQEEFFHTFNTLLESGCQVVITSDRPACEIQTFDTRLSSRFESGLTVSIASPDFETRVAILQSMLGAMKVKVASEAIHFIAEKIKSNVRRMEGALVRVATQYSLSPSSVSISHLREVLSDMLRQENTTRVTIDRIQKEVSEHFDLRLGDMTSRRRPANIARARQIAMFLSREMTKNSLAEIGDSFGGRDHGTVIHACKKVESDLKTDEYIKGEVDFLRAKLTR